MKTLKDFFAGNNNESSNIDLLIGGFIGVIVFISLIGVASTLLN